MSAIPCQAGKYVGTRTGYVGYRCRCEDCREAARIYERERLRKIRLANPLPSRPRMNLLSDTKLGWVAGILEGEGSFTLSSSKGRSKRIRVSVEMTDIDVVEGLYEVTGIGRVYICTQRKPEWKPSRVWAVSVRQDCFDLMQAVYPLMGKRRSAKIDECLAILSEYGVSG